MEKLSDNLLIEAFRKAKKYNLDRAFITLLEKELLKREIRLDLLYPEKNNN